MRCSADAADVMGDRSIESNAARRLRRERRAREAAELVVSERTRELFRQREEARELSRLLEENMKILGVVCTLHEAHQGAGVLGYRIDTGALWATEACSSLFGALTRRAEFLGRLPGDVVTRIEAFEEHAAAEVDQLRLSFGLQSGGDARQLVEMLASVVDAGGARHFVSVQRPLRPSPIQASD